MLNHQFTFYLVPHTHWDREWYLPFQEFRMRLVQLSRVLTEYMETNPNYMFTFDGQSIIFDDVTEVEPSTSEMLIKFAKNNQIKFGPWFVQPDEFLVSGESLTRNLFIGIKKAKDASNGEFLRVGYAPDLFGHVPQLGEIFNQFGINHLIFWRGIPMEIENSEFFWISPSGKRVLVTSLFQSYSNGLNLPSRIDLLESELKTIARTIGDKISSSMYLLMNGTDHEFPQIPLGELFANSKVIKYPEFNIKIATLDEYSEEVRELILDSALDKKLIEITGELRNTYRAPILSGVLSTRLYLKKKNAYLERLLEDYLIPLNSIINFLTGEDFSENINYLNEKLIVNHSHDCICGCSVDSVHQEMEHRFQAIKQMGKEVLETLKRSLACSFNHSGSFHDSKNSQLLVINPLSFGFNGLITVQFEPNFISNLKNKVTYDPIKPGCYQIYDKLDNSTTIINFEKGQEFIIKDYAIGRYHINRLEETIKTLAKIDWYPVDYRVKKVNEKSEFIFEFSRRKTKRKITSEEIKTLFKDLVLEKNEFIRVIFKSIPLMTGKLKISHINPFSFKIFSLSSYQQEEKKIIDNELNIKYGPFTIYLTEEKKIHLKLILQNQDIKINDFFQLEDIGDRGDEYNFCPLDSDEPVLPSYNKWSLLEHNSLYLKLKIDYRFHLPKEISIDRSKRSIEKTIFPLSVILTFYSNEMDNKIVDYPRIDFLVKFSNNVKDHRLRIKIKLPCTSEKYFTSSPYYVISRTSKLEVNDELVKESIEKPSKTVPQKEFITIKDEKKNIGCTLVNDGLPEIEYNSGVSEVKLTLLRATGWLSRSDLSTRNGHAGPEFSTPGAQCIGESICNFSLFFHPKTIEWAEIYRKAKNILSPPVSVLLNQEITNVKTDPFLKIKSKSFIITSFERIGNGFLIRGVNYSENKDSIEISSEFSSKFYKIANLVDILTNDLGKQVIENKVKDIVNPWELKNYFFRKS